MTAPAVREFEIFERGQIRDLVLDYFRSGLRIQTNPETGDLFTTDEIARATGPGTRWYREAQAFDDYGQGEQRRALFLNDQIRINRACTEWLEKYHAPQWDPDGRLPASPGSGQVTVTGTNGTHIVASTTVPDETAYWGMTASGVRVQVFAAEEAIGDTDDRSTIVTMIAMDPGASSNLEVGDVITWAQRDPGMDPEALVSGADWTGGFDAETDADWAARMEGNQRHRPGSGNDAQQRAWGRAASNAIEDVFVYPCAFGSNSFEVCVLQKRPAGNTSPTARIPSVAVLQAAIAKLTPPGSPVEPTPPMVVVVPPRRLTADFGVRLSLLVSAAAGWADYRPWPNLSATAGNGLPIVTAVGASTVTVFSGDDASLPGQAPGATITSNFPRMMGWSELTSRWTEIDPSKIVSTEDLGSGDYRITFTSTPTWLVWGTVISPFTAQHEAISQAVRDYLDERGPGELYASTDYRYQRCQRFPSLREEKPYAVGTEIGNRIIEALAGAATDSDRPYFNTTLAPAASVATPQMHFLGKVGIYPL